MVEVAQRNLWCNINDDYTPTIQIDLAYDPFSLKLIPWKLFVAPFLWTLDEILHKNKH
jgi:hypothetical protein